MISRRISLAILVLLGCGLSAISAETPENKSLDEFVACLKQAHDTFEKVEDYTCTLIKQERILGKLLPEQTAQMCVRQKPFSVYLKFTAPHNLNGQEVCYVDGKNNNHLRVKGSGLKGSLGFVSLPVNDPRVLSQSRHGINQSGMGNLIHNLKILAEEDQGSIKEIKVSSLEFEGKRCLRFDVSHPESTKCAMCRTVIYFDLETKLPLRFEGYDVAISGKEVQLVEAYTFKNLKTNVQLTDEQFKK